MKTLLLVTAVAPCTGEMIKNGLNVLERGENFCVTISI